jgi:homogentisate 1,2-dioxygenase
MTEVELKPVKLEGTLAFMFETRFVVKPTKFAMDCAELQSDYWECWQGLEPEFKKNSLF